VNNTRSVFGNLYVRARKGGPTLIRHGAVNATAEVLRYGEAGEQQYRQQESG
jgi:hypothetical protein